MTLPLIAVPRVSRDASAYPHSPKTSIADMAAPVRPHADDARSVVIPESGHVIPDEQPELLAEALLEFLE
ncbi:hypothetical protein B5808_00440 [Cnuibacter physcomitrellae]|uniref:AB hydrolase-1 domain-containing protein n=1 Tax=Cnuibacter physcomitrellae TaxID=1619308 RepID=A0A1X9LL74_9MICO|nr:hypothetical protein B5808_00440 [Cnuibacter physcomitrellae]